ncbi:IMP-specific 5'-nucleotidase [Thraustotheca clavata]|uniref:IMP-specific 5'-nucleotidase 1 n=1 Tax=Thraustotheca clavata TaxID=74557 RepID=A0A1V9ZCP0_9STRA|nr:IMP-specific 5'-nucleotidase [Thraustotheca clavata]
MLKEEDPLIELIREWIMAPIDESAGLQLTIMEVFALVEEMINEHVTGGPRLKKYIPKVRSIFVPLRLMDAVRIYDEFSHFSKRKRVAPTFKEIRHILNLATVHALAPSVKMVTFDADDTIYEDGGTISADSEMLKVIVELLKKGIIVSLVTAAGYPGEPHRYEARLRGILEALEVLTPEQRSRFLVMGGECNYLHVTETSSTGKVSLRVVPPSEWKDGRGERWSQEEVDELLDVAEQVLREMVDTFQMTAAILRKERAVGIYNTSTTKRLCYENLEETALTVQHALRNFTIPHCAFNGGNDVFVDIGNKALGISALQHFVGSLLPEPEDVLQGHQCLHVGDRFTRTGNDTKARDVASTVWVSNPQETALAMDYFLTLLP